jgi:hypothetical protein
LPGKGWDDVMRKNGGTADKTTDVAVSMPNAMVANALGTGSEGAFYWKRSGANPFIEASAVFHINPTTLAGVLAPSSGVLQLGAQYIGYFMENTTFGGAAAITRHKIATPLAPNVWTEVKLVWEAAGKFNLFYNDINVLGISGFSTADTMVGFRLGAFASGNMGPMPVHRFDDVRLSIRR